MNGPETAARAVRDALPMRGVFPAIGQVTACQVTRGGDGVVDGLSQLMVTVNGVAEDCLWSGSLLMEARVAGAGLIGRDVKVELLGGELIAAYTINGSAIDAY